MRTTLTLDDDIFALLSALSNERGTSFKQAVNDCLRAGLTARQFPDTAPFVVKPFNLGLPAGLSYSNIGQLLDDLDGPERL